MLINLLCEMALEGSMKTYKSRLHTFKNKTCSFTVLHQFWRHYILSNV